MGRFISGEKQHTQDTFFHEALSHYAESTTKNLSKTSIEKSN
ncbi:MAG: hypothetical protein ACOYKA_02510 [Legionellaceae bacterium]